MGGNFEAMKFGVKNLRTINNIYSNQSVAIRINDDLTKSFSVQKGTRQGCPLSPLLFILVLGVLLNEIQRDNQIVCIKIENFHFKYTAFADHVVFFIEDPKENLLILLRKIEEFGQLAGFYINKNKSKFLFKDIGGKEQEEIGKMSNCEVAQKVKYLGIDLTSKNIDIFKNNYEKLWRRIKEDLILWNHQKLSLMGRIATIKMNVLPRILYLFQTIPVMKKRDHFKNWKKDITDFTWAGRKPSIKYKILCNARERRGLQTPNLELYYEVSCLT